MPNRPAPSCLLSALDLVERAGNRLPHPVTLFVILAAIVLAGSAVTASFGLAVTHPRTGETVQAVSLLNRAGIQRVFTRAVENFASFAPLGTVLVAVIGVGVAERSGLFAALLRAMVTSVPQSLITMTVVFAGIMSNVASDAGYLILPPLAAALYAGLGRHPLAGIAAAFAGVAGGFSANLLPSTLDVLLAGLTQAASEVLHPGYQVNVLCNYYFLAASVPVLTLLGTWISVRFVEPRLGPWTPDRPTAADADPAERRGLRAAGWTALVTLGLIASLVVPPWGPLRGEPPAGGEGTIVQQIDPFLRSMVAIVFIAFLLPGLAFGIATRRIRSDKDVAVMSGEAMGAMGSYIVLAFVAAQFVKYFEWSNLGLIIAVSGANALKALHFEGVPLFIGFVLLSITLDMFVGSASAKWAVLGPVFVPMLMQLGYSPEATQVIYRVGDSVVNPITPLNPYFPIVLAFAQRYDRNIGIGSLVSVMLPYSIAFALLWTTLLVIWLVLGLPLGPGAALHYAA